jgi:orotidine-5'-phosphate decarboxylase
MPKGSAHSRTGRKFIRTDTNKEDEMKKVLILAATVAAALSIGVATSAATPTTPGGYCGAMNMLQAWPGGGANVPDGGGMENAMTVDNANGNTGMFTAVGASAC